MVSKAEYFELINECANKISQASMEVTKPLHNSTFYIMGMESSKAELREAIEPLFAMQARLDSLWIERLAKERGE